jgi:DNA polymerase-3 subunit epsilon
MTPFVAIDFETADEKRDSACAVGVARVEGSEVVYRASWLIRPPRSVVSPICYDIHRLSWDTLKDEPSFADVWPEVLPALEGVEHLVAHNAAFDKSVMTTCCELAGLPVPAMPWICTVKLCKEKWKGQEVSNKLPAVCNRLGIPLIGHHEASRDAVACAQILIALQERKPEVKEKVKAVVMEPVKDQSKEEVKEVGELCECGLRCVILRAGLCLKCFLKLTDSL